MKAELKKIERISYDGVEFVVPMANGETVTMSFPRHTNKHTVQALERATELINQRDALIKALKVLVFDERTAKWLRCNDPKALEQANGALHAAGVE